MNIEQLIEQLAREHSEHMAEGRISADIRALIAEIRRLNTRVAVLESNLDAAANELDAAYHQSQILDAVRALLKSPPAYRRDDYPRELRALIRGDRSTTNAKGNNT